MFAVFADDFTGAAEIAGLALHYQLSVEICTSVKQNTLADLLIVSADTRSMDEATAVVETERIITQLLKMNPSFIYKKIDSVLRGHILPEIGAQQKLLHAHKVLIIPANPSLGRTISNGNYFYKGKLIHLSSFSQDPEFAIDNSDLKQMIRSKAELSVLKAGTALPENDISIGEVENQTDLHHWASLVDANTLPVGAGDFFSALLSVRKIPIATETTELIAFEKPALFVCGTTFGNSVASIKKLEAQGAPVSYMSASVIHSTLDEDAGLKDWAMGTTALLKDHGKAILAIDAAVVDAAVTALSLRQKMAAVVAFIFDKIGIKELFIEGGSTAAAVIRLLAFDCFYPVAELKRGVVRMKVANRPGLYITVKPGSYDWPTGVWEF